jgi:hypothetical protein
LEIAIDPVETGFPGAGMSRETQSLIPAGETLLQEVPYMEETPPESKPGFA